MAPKVTNLPDDHRIMRHVPWGKLRRDENDNVIGFLGQAFELRPDEDSLSVSWVEYYEDAAHQVRDAVWAMRKARIVGGKSAFAIADVGKVKEVCRTTRGGGVRIVHEPLEDWPSHSGIRQLPRDDASLLDALAADAFVEIVLNMSISTQPEE